MNDDQTKYKLKSLDGEFAALQLVCFMYVGWQSVEPSIDLGVDMKAEYEAALAMLNH